MGSEITQGALATTLGWGPLEMKQPPLEGLVPSSSLCFLTCRTETPPQSPLEDWRHKVISGTRQWSLHALLPDWEGRDELGAGEEGAE